MFFNFYFIILMIRIFSDCKISYTFPIHKTLAEFFFCIGRKCAAKFRPHCLLPVLAGVYVALNVCCFGIDLCCANTSMFEVHFK